MGRAKNRTCAYISTAPDTMPYRQEAVVNRITDASEISRSNLLILHISTLRSRAKQFAQGININTS